MNNVTELIKDVPIPRMVRVRQAYDRACIPAGEIAAEMQKQLSRPRIADKIKPGMRIAITCGSRGINHYAVMVKTMADFVKSRGAEPFIAAAMGSHGGATEDGQRQIL
ncbi:MAG: hypothetical protein AB7C97_12635, partial [Oscillospiraceae bacterium]